MGGVGTEVDSGICAVDNETNMISSFSEKRLTHRLTQSIPIALIALFVPTHARSGVPPQGKSFLRRKSSEGWVGEGCKTPKRGVAFTEGGF